MDDTKSSVQEELSQLAPWLRDVRQAAAHDGFQVPEGYWEGLEDRVMARIHAEVASPAPVLTARPGGRWWRARPLWAAAAAVTAVAAALWLLRPAPPASVAAVDLSEEEVAAYVVENVQEFDVEQLATLPHSDWAETDLTPQNLPPASPTSEETLHPEDVELLLRDMSEEELESIL